MRRKRLATWLGCALLLALALTVASAREARASTPRTIVLAAGVNRSFDPRLAPLRFAETDAERLATTLVSLGEVTPEATTLLNGSTVEDFVHALTVLTDEENEDTRLVLYFSGHADDRGLHFRDGALSRERLHALLRSGTAKTKVVFIDSCFSGTIAAKGVHEAESFDLPRVAIDDLSGSVFLTASSGREAAYESEELSGGLFTHDVLAGLNGAADGDGDGLVTVDELYRYVFREMRSRQALYPTRRSQTPEYHADLHGHGALVLSRPRRGLGLLRLDSTILGAVYLNSLNGLGGTTVYGTGDGPAEYRVATGTYRAVIRRGDLVGEATVMVAREAPSELRSDGFQWHTIDSSAREVTRGLSVTNQGRPTVQTMVGLRHALGMGYQETLVERSACLWDGVYSGGQLALYGHAGLLEGEGRYDGENLSALGAEVASSGVLKHAGLALRPTFGVSLTREWRRFSDPRDLEGGGAAPLTQTVNMPAYFVGALLPVSDMRAGHLSVLARRDDQQVQNRFGRLRDQPSYLLGLVVEP